MTTWREHSIVEDARYRVIEAFSSSTDRFEAGEVLIFVDTAYSPYDGMTGFRFRSPAGDVKAFDVADNDQIEIWMRRLEPITEGQRPQPPAPGYGS